MSVALNSGVRWRYSLLVALVQRELASRYRGSVLGPLWPLLIQISQLFVFTYLFAFIFHARAPVPTLPGTPAAYGLWLFAGLLPWTAFSIGITQAATSVIAQAALIKKVVFPLAIIPMVPIFAGLLESFIGLLLLIAFATTVVGFSPRLVLILPLAIVLQIVFGCGVAYAAACLTVFFRDIPQGLGPALLVGFYLTPVIYAPTQMPHQVEWLNAINPLAAIVALYRAAIFREALDATTLVVPILISFASFAAGWALYKKLRPGFADVL